jgi:hypothetical protein
MAENRNCLTRLIKNALYVFKRYLSEKLRANNSRLQTKGQWAMANHNQHKKRSSYFVNHT